MASFIISFSNVPSFLMIQLDLTETGGGMCKFVIIRLAFKLVIFGRNCAKEAYLLWISFIS